MTMVGGRMAFDRLDEYEVQAGDTVTQIAIKHKLPEKHIRQINQLFDDRLAPGEIILIPIKEEPQEDIAVVAQNSEFKITTKVEKSPKSIVTKSPESAEKKQEQESTGQVEEPDQLSAEVVAVDDD